jgi:hypothetical protein
MDIMLVGKKAKGDKPLKYIPIVNGLSISARGFFILLHPGLSHSSNFKAKLC